MELITPERRKVLAFNNVFTSVVLLLVILYLNMSDDLYDVGKYNKFWILSCFASLEIIKSIIYYNTQKKTLKSAELKHYRLSNLFKSFLTFLLMVGVYYVIVVLFGAPFLTHQEQNLMFALILSIFTILPVCLHCGHEAGLSILLTLTNYDGNELFKKFVFNARLTFLGAWFGACVIPLDWEKPYQEWPIPCYFGAVFGYLVSNVVSYVAYKLKISVKGFSKYNL